MLGQHPNLYGLPELNLTVVDTMAQWLRLWRRVRPLSMHGLLRTVAQLQFNAQTEPQILQAKQWLDERKQWSTKEMFHYIAQKVAPRQVVEKSPSHVLDGSRLYRLHEMFPQGRFLHLSRHPESTCRSICALTDEITARNTPRNRSRSAATDAEMIWRHSHQNILQFWKTLKPGQGMRLQGEALLQHPEVYLPQIAQWLKISVDNDAIQAMYHPERSPFAKLGPSNARFGNDPKFLRNPNFRLSSIPICSPLANSEFASETQSIARVLGYR